MKYLIDIVLVLALCGLGWLWNGEKQKGLALGDEMDQLKATVARFEGDLIKSNRVAADTAEALDAAKVQGAQLAAELLAKTETLAARETEVEELRGIGLKQRARIAELEGYKARSIVAEMPKPISQ